MGSLFSTVYILAHLPITNQNFASLPNAKMDFLKKGADMLNKNKEGGSAQQQNTGTTGGAAAPAQGQAGGSAAGGQGYGDKAFGFISKKAGYNVDPSTGEKITDGARGLYEKQTGSKVELGVSDESSGMGSIYGWS